MHFHEPILNKSRGVSRALLSDLGQILKTSQGVGPAFLSNLGQILNKSQGVSPAFLSNFGQKLNKSLGVSPAILSNLGQILNKSQGVSPAIFINFGWDYLIRHLRLLNWPPVPQCKQVVWIFHFNNNSFRRYCFVFISCRLAADTLTSNEIYLPKRRYACWLSSSFKDVFINQVQWIVSLV